MTLHDSSTWRRAAVYGSLWAGVEIVVGSFLHNLRIPLSGSLLSAVGVILMTAAHRASPERGLMWRAALVCALMKSVSPSAVVLGPMIGIFMEGLLLEAMVRVFGGRAAGYLAGGALAVSWSMAQRLLNALIAFGPNVVRLYVEAYTYASRSLGIASFGPFDLVAVFLAVEMAAGCVAAMIGLTVPSLSATPVAAPRPATAAWFPGPPTVVEGRWSLPRLAVVGVALLAGMAFVGSVALWVAAGYVAVFALLVLRTYPRAARRVRRVSLWLELAGLTVLSGLVFGGVRHGLAGLVEGAGAGVLMALRATMVVFGFTAISVELRNPAILSFVERHGARGLSDALGVAFGALPTFIAALSERRDLWRRPRVLAGFLLQTANALVRTPAAGARVGPTIVLTGETGSGKTTFAGLLADRLRARGLSVAGILAPGLLSEGRRSGFDIIDLATKERGPLARERQEPPERHARWSRFGFDSSGLALGRRALSTTERDADVVLVDEVGPFELSGGGWAEDLDALRAFPGVVVLVVRRSIVDEVVARWGSPGTILRDVSVADLNEVAGEIEKSIPKVLSS